MVYGHLSASSIKTERRKFGPCIYAQLVQGRFPIFFFKKTLSFLNVIVYFYTSCFYTKRLKSLKRLIRLHAFNVPSVKIAII